MNRGDAADALQHAWLLPFEVCDLTPERPAPSWGVVCDDATVLRPSSFRDHGEIELASEPPVLGAEHAFLVAAHLGGEWRLAGTDAWAMDTVALPDDAQADEAWLLRVTRTANSAPQTLVLRGPEPVQARRVIDGPCAILLDLGMVLMRFERERVADSFYAIFGTPLPGPAWEFMESMRPALEAGDLLADEFLERSLEPCRLVGPDRDALAAAWASLLTKERGMLALARQLRERPATEVVVVSTTDPILLRSLREEPEVAPLLESVVASCQDGVRPKSEDASMWVRARDLAATKLGAEPQAVIAIDDVRAYVASALSAGAATHGIGFRSLGQCRYELGRCGVYLPSARVAAS